MVAGVLKVIGSLRLNLVPNSVAISGSAAGLVVKDHYSSFSSGAKLSSRRLGPCSLLKATVTSTSPPDRFVSMTMPSPKVAWRTLSPVESDTLGPDSASASRFGLGSEPLPCNARRVSAPALPRLRSGRHAAEPQPRR